MLRAEAAARDQAHEEQAHDLAKTQERLSEHESYVTELQGRFTKLTARNESSEAYIRDLEQKFRTYSENDDRQADVIAGLTKEIQDLKAESAKSNTYITQLEQRISASDNRATELADLVERYEREAEERESTVRELESRIAMFDNQQDVNMLLEELESRERRIQELEDKLSKSKVQALVAGAAGAATAAATTVAVTRSSADMPEDVDEDEDDLSIVSRPSMEAKQGEPGVSKIETEKSEEKSKDVEEAKEAEEVPKKLEPPTVKEPEAEASDKSSTNGHVAMPREIDLSDDLPEGPDADITPKKSTPAPTVALARDVPALEPSHDAPKSTSPTPPETPALRTIAEDSESEVDILRKENEALLMRLREIEMRHEMQHPATPALEPPSEHDEELEDEDDERDEDSTTTNNKRGSTGNESSESETTLQTPKLASRAVSPQIHTDDPLSLQRSPYAAFRASSIDARRINSERILRPLSLSQSINGLAYMSNSPRYSWSPPANGNGTLTAYERSPKFDRSPKRQSMPFESKPMRSVQSLEIDLNLLQKAVTDRDAQLKQREAEIKYLKKTLEQGTTPASFDTEDVIERLRREHADEIDKIFVNHARSITALEDEHNKTARAIREKLEETLAQHKTEMEEMREEHARNIAELETRHKQERGESTDMKSALDAAWEELAATGRRHQQERDNLVASHNKDIAEVEQRHADVMSKLQNELTASSAAVESLRKELAAANEAKIKAEQELSERTSPAALAAAAAAAGLAAGAAGGAAAASHNEDMVPAEDHNMIVQAMEEMEKELQAAEDEKRQLKMKADQFKFELSKIRDEHEVQRSADLNKLAELEKRCSVLTAETAELKQQNQELSKNRDSKQLIDRSSRSKLPPIGPPPTAPLPPLPAGREAILSPTLTNASLPGRTSAHEGSVESARSSKYDSHDGHAVSLRPESLVTVAEVEKALAEREEALAHLTEARDKLVEMEAQLSSAQKDNEAFTKDLIELRKNNSKLKVRVDDVNREMAELKRERDSLRRDLVEIKNELADCQYERIADRQRLEASKTELAQCKAKLDRMVDAKVSKRSDRKLKCF